MKKILKKRNQVMMKHLQKKRRRGKKKVDDSDVSDSTKIRKKELKNFLEIVDNVIKDTEVNDSTFILFVNKFREMIYEDLVEKEKRMATF